MTGIYKRLNNLLLSCLLIGGLVSSCPALVSAKGKSTKEIVLSGNKKRVYYLFGPEKPDAAKTLPLIVLLHGSGRNGQTLIDPWKELADKENVVLVAPDSRNPATWSLGPDGPEFLRDVVEAVKTKYPIDSRRVYLFGHSGGAIFALLMSLLESEYFASAAVHAGALRNQDSRFFEDAKRKIPVALFVGDRDPLFPVEGVRATREMFVTRGFPVKLVEIPNHTHWYYDKAEKINRDVWIFLKEHVLTAEPRYEHYEFATN